MGRGKNALKILYVHKALSTIDAELQLINLKINHPEQFKLSIPTAFKSDLYVIPKSKDLGIIGIAEIVLALFLQGANRWRRWKTCPRSSFSSWL